MAKGIDTFLNMVDGITKRISRPASLLVIVIMGCISFEVISRYVFNRPTNWVWPITRQLFCLFILIAGVYTMSKNDHIRIEIIYDFFPPWVKQGVRIFTILCMLIFLGVLVWQSAWMGWDAILARETNPGSFRILPLYPIKSLIPLFSFLFLLQGLSVFRRCKDNDKKEDSIS